MKISAHAGETRDGLPLAELRDGDRVLLKAYPNAAGDKIRIVLPGVRDFRAAVQRAKIDEFNKMFEFKLEEKL